MCILIKLLNGLVSDINLWRPTFDTIFECFTWILHLFVLLPNVQAQADLINMTCRTKFRPFLLLILLNRKCDFLKQNKRLRIKTKKAS